MLTNYDKLKDKAVILYDDKGTKIFITVKELVNYLNQTPQILDKVEKRYIRNIVAPFWKLVKYVVKRKGGRDDYYIDIMYEEVAYNSRIHLYLPSFSIDSDMYANMEVDRRYTLEELGVKFK